MPGVQLQIKFTKSTRDLYVFISKSDTEAVLIFLEDKMRVRHVNPSPSIQLSHSHALEKGNDRYDINTVQPKTYTFGADSNIVSIDDALLVYLPKQLLLTNL